MTSKALSVLMMGSVSLILISVLAFVTFGQSHPGPLWLWTSWLVSLALTAAIVWQAKTSRSAWGYLSLIGGIISFVVLLAIIFVPVSASAPYEPGVDWLRAVDLTPPIVARLGEAIASAYFAITIIIAGMIFLFIAYLLLHLPGGPKRHAH